MDTPCRSASAQSQPDSRLAGIRLLLAEDNEINQIIAARMLKKAGAQVVVVHHGREALERLPLGLDGAPFDLALLDVEMPELDGCETARQIRTDPRFCTLPIIALTAHTALEDRQRCLEAGMNDQLAKPINLEQLLATLQRWLPHLLEGRSSVVVAEISPAETGLPELAELPHLAGLDTAAGLQRAGGDGKLYRDLLARYHAGQADTPAQIQAALLASDRATAERLAHTLKGVSGAIGATTVQRLAATLEQTLRQGAGLAAVEPLLTETGAALAELITALHAVTPAEPVPAVSAVDPAALAVILTRLESLLRDDDTEAADYLADHRQTLVGTLPDAPFAALVQAITNYDFVEALQQLALISGQFND